MITNDRGKKLYFILPVFNEEESIQSQLFNICDFVKNNNYNYKIVVVDDGSSDRSSEYVELLKPNIQVEVIKHKFNRGPSAAFKTAFLYLEPNLNSEDIVVTMDADNTQNISLIKKMIEDIDSGYDIVVGSVFINGGSISGISKKRYLLTYCCNKLYSWLFPITNITTYTGFLRGHKGGIIKKLLAIYGDNIITNQGFGGMSEFILKLRNLKLLIKEEPMVIRYDNKKSRSKLKFLPTIWEHIKVIIAAFWDNIKHLGRTRNKRRYLKLI